MEKTLRLLEMGFSENEVSLAIEKFGKQQLIAWHIAAWDQWCCSIFQLSFGSFNLHFMFGDYLFILLQEADFSSNSPLGFAFLWELRFAFLMLNFKPLTSINISGSETQVSELADSIVTGRIASDYPGDVKVLTLELCQLKY